MPSFRLPVFNGEEAIKFNRLSLIQAFTSDETSMPLAVALLNFQVALVINSTVVGPLDSFLQEMPVNSIAKRMVKHNNFFIGDMLLVFVRKKIKIGVLRDPAVFFEGG